jgi:very-short-patch-repair endonuclease
LPRDAVIWAALLYAGRGATASHETAAELWGLADPQSVVHVTIPVERRVPSIPGVQIHYAHRLPTSRHPLQSPPVTTVEDTVLDLIDRCVRMDEVQMWVTRACQRRRTTPERLGLALDDRKKIRWRVATSKLIAEVSSGAETPLEVAYARRVERAHGLPVGRRQRHRHAGLRSQWSDVEYEDYRTVVELDGRVGHVEDGRFRDHRRDNAASLRGDVTLRYGWSDTTSNSCHVAAEVAAVLRRNGWSGSPRPCGPGCVIHQAAA